MTNVLDILQIDDYKKFGVVANTDGFLAFYLANLSKAKNKNILVVVNTLYDANKLYNLVNSLCSNVYLFPMDDFLMSDAVAISPDLLINRMETLRDVVNNKSSIIITNLMGFLRFLPSKSNYLSHVIKLNKGMEIKPDLLYQRLVSAGYKTESLVTNTGEVGKRGFVIDLFPIGEDNPVRFEFFGDEIDEIKYFDADNQKSFKNIDSITIYPNTEFLTDKDVENDHIGKQKYLPVYEKVFSLLDYLDDGYLLYRDYSMLEVGYKKICEEITEYRDTKDTLFKGNYMNSLSDLSVAKEIYYMNIDNLSKYQHTYNYDVRSINKFNENPVIVSNFITNSISDNKTVIIFLKEYQIKNFVKNINISYKVTTLDKIYNNKVNIVVSDFNQGFIYNDYVFITRGELFKEIESSRKYKTKFKYSAKITDINKLEVGDYVVHSIHGIGIYQGIKDIELNGITKDYIEVLYRDNDKLYIPVEKIDNLYKFSSKEGVVPKINKLSSNEFLKTKKKVSERVKIMAGELISLYAEREKRKGFAFSKDNELMEEFEECFPYSLTSDQINSIKQIKNGMEKDSPMDMLLCGDVGFGKTEVAFVAAFKAVNDSKQVLMLCPTTILSNQHYKNAMERFKDFPINIKLLNRFTSSREVTEIYEGLADGTIDMVIGTHKLLNDKIRPKDLGLLIIDEEQRFGVRHKEKIKQYKTSVDVLTLTATPIPRTLQMSLAGIRSLSLIETPPINRFPVQTYVIEENNQIIKDAINKELARGGQVFLLYNKVETIEEKVFEISSLVPEARVTYAHGRMKKEEIEDKMLQFTDNQYDVLVCTTIIETGIDIPNVNTLIILDADKFGLSQLYQIRGRVGRSSKFAYAYLMYDGRKILGDAAVKRLNVIKEFTELGSGFSIATRDLSIRGAGNILGSEQAGFIDSVGMDLYMKMLNDEVSRRRGIEVEEEQDDTKPLINVDTHIKDSYVSDEDLKIEIHRKINLIDSEEKFNEIKRELEDRFGKIDQDMIIYMYEEWFEKLADDAKIYRVNETKNFIELIFDRDSINNVNVEDLFVKSFNISPMFRYQKRGNFLVIILDTIKLDKHPLYYLVPLLQLFLSLKS